MTNTFLKVKNISKFYGKHQVLKDITFSLDKGEILGLVGANGSGKSTLMNIIFGHQVIKTTGGYIGEITLDGKVLNSDQNDKAMDFGIGMVHQEFALFPKLTIAENIKLCNENTFGSKHKAYLNKYKLIRRKQDDHEAQKRLKSLGIDINPEIMVQDISTNIKQFIEIARELDRHHLKLLILDEPTAVLNTRDSQLLIEALESLKQKGVSILFISHRLEEVMKVSDKLLVLRDGEMVSFRHKEETDIHQLALEMIGEKVQKTISKKDKAKKDIQLSFRNYQVHYPGEMLKDFTLDIFKGEILGITSLSGHGKLAISKGLIGFYPSQGNLLLNGQDISELSYREKIRKGIYVLCEDRKNVGLLLNHSIEDNIVFTAQQLYKKYSKDYLGGLLKRYDKKAADQEVNKYIEELDIICRSPKQAVHSLSGGNQQKVCLARSLSLAPSILFVSEPTRGIDIAAKEKVLKCLMDFNRHQGMTLIITSSELEELQRLCDRIVVISEGKIASILAPDASAKDFGLAFSAGGEQDDL